jgi:hypothetical protein
MTLGVMATSAAPLEMQAKKPFGSHIESQG